MVDINSMEYLKFDSNYCVKTNPAYGLNTTDDAVGTDPVTPSNVNTTAYAASLIIKASAGTCYYIRGYNSGAAQFIQVLDSATLPANGVAPEDLISVAATSPFSIPYPQGKLFAAGIVVCNSSTGPTKTIGAADCWFSAEYK